MNQVKENIFRSVDEIKNELIEINDFIHDNPELGNEEFKASKLLMDTLNKYGFNVEKGIVGIETAFKAVYKNGENGPKIGLLCEYDALEGQGHGCGHNLQGPAIVGAAIALIKNLGDIPAEIIVYGTPAEETKSAKLPMVAQGIFDDLDIALMMHGGDRTTVDSKSLALNLIDFVFTGTASHAAVAPDKGRSALDGVIMMFNGIEYLREHVTDDVRMHGIIKEGGVSANTVPKRAVSQFYIRAANREYLNDLLERVYKVAEGAAMATGTEVEIKQVKAYDNKINIQSLNDVLLANARLLNAPNVTPPREKTGSTDFSSVTYRVPGACLRVAFVPQGTPSHSEIFVQEGAAETGHNAVIIGAKGIAASCYDILSTSGLLEKIKEEFSNNKKGE